MPKGIPANGKRAPWGSKTRNGQSFTTAIKHIDNVVSMPVHNNQNIHVVVNNETDEEIETRIKDRFSFIKTFTDAAFTGDCRSLIVTGPAGLGKSYAVESALREWDQDGDKSVIIKGYVRAPGLIKTLYHYRHPGNVVVFDDADAIFNDETALNYLKAACDTTETRHISVLSEYKLIDEESSELIPRTFKFEGSIIFISNYNFDRMIERNHKFSPHFEALMSRSHYIDCGMDSTRDYIIRIKQVVSEGLMDHLNWAEKSDVLTFIEEHKNDLRELSLRMVVKLAGLRKTYGVDWRRVAKITCLTIKKG